MVFPALSLIDYDPAYHEVMKYVFGGKFVCANMNIAKQVAFNPQIHVSCVTLDGDDFNPDGVLSGGSRANKESVLIKLNEVKAAAEELRTKQEMGAQLDRQIEGQRAKVTFYLFKCESWLNSGNIFSLNLQMFKLDKNQSFSSLFQCRNPQFT